MRTKACTLTLTALFASVMSGQPVPDEQVDRIFRFTNTSTARDLQEAATVLRTIAGVTHLFVDGAAATVSMSGTAGEVAMAGWLIHEMDQPGRPDPPSSAIRDTVAHEYRVPDNQDDVIRVAWLTQTGRHRARRRSLP